MTEYKDISLYFTTEGELVVAMTWSKGIGGSVIDYNFTFTDKDRIKRILDITDLYVNLPEFVSIAENTDETIPKNTIKGNTSTILIEV